MSTNSLLLFCCHFCNFEHFSHINLVSSLMTNHMALSPGFYIFKDKSRSSHRRCSVRKGVLRNFAKFTEKHLYQSLFFNKVAGLRPTTLFKKRLWHRCLPVSFVKFLRTPFYRTPLGDCFCKFDLRKNILQISKLVWQDKK